MAGLADLAELVRAPAALSVPGDLVAGASAAGVLTPATGALSAASVCLYWAGMAANDWADRHLDATERPERPIPSGRVRPGAAFGLAAGLTAAGLGVAAAVGGRRSLAVALPLAATIWAYDLRAKNTPAGPAVMAACRALDVLLGATTTPRSGPLDASGAVGRALWRALPAAAVIAAHTYTVTELSRREVSGATPALPATTLTATAALSAAIATSTPHRAGPGLKLGDPSTGGATPTPRAAGLGSRAVGFGSRVAGLGRRADGVGSRAASLGSRAAGAGSRDDGSASRAAGTGSRAAGFGSRDAGSGARAAGSGFGGAGFGRRAAGHAFRGAGVAVPAGAGRWSAGRAAVVGALVGQYLAGYGAAQVRAILSPGPGTIRAAVGAGITALPALQGALTARAGSSPAGIAVAAAAPLARLLARKVSPT
ncbi:4-hydroxybenzoate polyprenyltransferase [Catenuloplanes nepalensis]|uniref:4-hydroxybenzoate polyprenyltransferase n=1 Tax=Catenuloplanes nepalensis TaxID=587533 RepID=A0ABT9MTE0_9ACTN|nr:UbiA family prenyltransferase [Catenuloplanes nepalensis]MDP9794699.1 4-hydroxybenzoate polyprenyltransferase [Catenuloplanes nepalensis]